MTLCVMCLLCISSSLSELKAARLVVSGCLNHLAFGSIFIWQFLTYLFMFLHMVIIIFSNARKKNTFRIFYNWISICLCKRFFCIIREDEKISGVNTHIHIRIDSIINKRIIFQNSTKTWHQCWNLNLNSAPSARIRHIIIMENIEL